MTWLRAPWLFVAAAALCAALGGYWLAQQLDRASPRLASGTWLPQPKAVREFRLTDTTGRAFTRAELLEQVWGWSFGDLSTITVYVRRLRDKVEREPGSPTQLQTVWGVGYRWEANPS